MKVLYLSYDGISDHLGQSQVLPYLRGLTKLGHKFTLVSFEKEEKYLLQKDKLIESLNENSISWHPLLYHKSPPVLSTLYDIYKLKSLVKELHQKEKFDIVHCRSYITALIGQWMKKTYAVRFVFDMRGFYADERVDGKIWNLSSPLYKSIFNYFKRKELEFFQQSDYLISLTQNAADKIHTWKNIPDQPIKIMVIPCCADLDHFNRSKLNTDFVETERKKLGISDSDFVISYLGSIGTWYMLKEMIAFFKVFLESRPQAIFLFITGESPDLIYKEADEFGIPHKHFRILSSPYEHVPQYLSMSDLAMFFIKPVFSKSASSPTKQGEIMGMGIPIVCNGNVGDTDTIIWDTNAGIVVESFDDENYRKVSEQVDELLSLDKEDIRNGAKKHYSLEKGIERYNRVYKEVMG